jgi:hypothetical protein
MNKTYLLAAVVGGLFILSRMPKAKQQAQKTAWADEIFYGDPNGWRYFSDGTAIDPEGNYYRGGALIYRAS